MSHPSSFNHYLNTIIDGKYRVDELMASGGMGQVFRVTHVQLNKTFALKLMHRTSMNFESNRLVRFRREAEALARINHPNVVSVTDYGLTTDDTPYIVMEFVEGSTLRQLILERGKLAEREAIQIAKQLCAGLYAAHIQGVVHRDLKPENIMIQRLADGEIMVHILDFGISKLLIQTNDDPSISLANEMLGTIRYMTPEQIIGDEIDMRSDIFSICLITYELLAGFVPPAATQAVPPVISVRSDISPRLSEIIARGIEMVPDNRYQTAVELKRELESLEHATLVESVVEKYSGQYQPVPDQLPQQNTQSRGIDSLAIFPFENAGKDADAEYLTDGLTETIINIMSQLPSLRVIARATVFRYRGADPISAGRELNVRAALTGRVISRNDTLIVKTELIDIARGTQLWGEQYQRKLDDIFNLQEEIARKISERLRFKLSGDESKLLGKRYTDNAEAYQLYLKGRYFWNRRTVEHVKKGIEYFEEAARLDNHYALAYTGIADSYNILGGYEVLPPKDAFPKAKSAAVKALIIDDSLAEAHTSLAVTRYRFDWDWSNAEKEFRRAIELNANYATGHHWYGLYLGMMGRFDEALEEVRQAQRLDPLSLSISAARGLILYYSHRFDEAIEQYRKTLELDDNFAPAHVDLGLVYARTGRYKEAVIEAQMAMKLYGYEELGIAMGEAFKRDGHHGALRAWLEVIHRQRQQRYVSPYRIARIYAGLGEQDAAFEWLNNAVKDRSNGLAWLKVDPVLDSLRPDPRFQKLLNIVGLTTEKER